MTKELDSFAENEYSNGLKGAQDNLDKLNAVTFGDERGWIFDKSNIENEDSHFKRFEFSCELENDSSKNDYDDLLGLERSLYDFEGLKPSPDKDENTTLNNNEIDDFEIALTKLNLLDAEGAPGNTSLESMTSSFQELEKYSEILLLQFQNYQKSDASSDFLNGIVSKHLDLLCKKLTQLSLDTEVLPRLRYFTLLSDFVSKDHHVQEIRSKSSKDPQLCNRDILSLAKECSLKSLQNRVEVSAVHPLYINSDSYSSEDQVHRFKIDPPPPSSSRRPFDANSGGWLSPCQRAYIQRVQTRNLVSENPYLHDYYYTVLKFKEMDQTRASQLSTLGHTSIQDPLSLLPSPITTDQLRSWTRDGEYHPAQFEHSLTLHTESLTLNSPRPIIQVPHRQKIHPRTVPEDESSYTVVRSQRQLLGLIEKVHDIILRLDDVDKSLAKMVLDQHHYRAVLLHHRGYLLKVLMDFVDSNSRLVHMFSVSKGAQIISSVLTVVTSLQFVQLIKTFFYNCLSIWESDFFQDFESDLESVIRSRVRKLNKEELSLLITTFFCNMTPEALHDKMRLQPLTGFCRRQFGINVVFTVLDSFFLLSPEDKSNVDQLVRVTLASSDTYSGFLPQLQKDFHVLF